MSSSSSLSCVFCNQSIEEGDEVADVQFGEAETNTSNEFVGEIVYSSQIETSHLDCYVKALDLFQEKGGA